jgi:hypothetical protein
MKPTKQATYLEELRKERNYYKENWEEAVSMVNAEIQRINNTISKFKKSGKLSQMSLVSAQYELKFLQDLKQKLGKKLK